MAQDSRIGSKLPDFARDDLVPGLKLDSGPYIGKIKNANDPAKLGRLQVYIPELSSGNEDDPRNWRTVVYCSPYFGTTVPSAFKGTQNTYGYTKESYGFWMTPPDVGSLVICIFINGRADRGYYIGCIPDETSHHMVPGLSGNPRAKFNELTERAEKWADGNTYLPVAEFNDGAIDLTKTPDLYAGVERPVHYEQLKNLYRQGLISDNQRGVISSSSQRESPSRVFGFSTPGRILNYNTEFPKEVFQRAGGHSLVMDDGDASGRDNLVRLRTSAGHQIMMNDSAGIIYIISASGKNWIEMGADGSVRVYAESDITMRSESNINFISDAAFNVNAKSINLKASTVAVESSGDINLFASSNIIGKSGARIAFGSSKFDVAAAKGTISCEGELGLVGDKLKLNSSAMTTVNEPAKIPDISIVPTAEPWIARPEDTADDLGDVDSPEIAPASRPTTAPSTPSVSPVAGVQPNLPPLINSQPDPSGPIGTLTLEQTKALMASIAASESGGNYRAVNSLGYSGKYQFGMAALEDLGYVKKGSWAKYKKNKFLANPEVWTGKDGINTLEDWLNSTGVQEKVMEKNLRNNYNTLVRLGSLNSASSPGQVGGLLKVAHLLGAGGARNWAQGKGGQDAYGTSGDKYFAQGKTAVETVSA